MSVWRFIRVMVVALLIVAVCSYLMTGSLLTAFIQTALCSVLLQVGYFIYILVLVWRASRDPLVAPPEETDALGGADDGVQTVAPIFSLDRL